MVYHAYDVLSPVQLEPFTAARLRAAVHAMLVGKADRSG